MVDVPIQLTVAAYGLAFFAMGLVVGVRAGICPPSQLRRRLFALAGFGLLYAGFVWSMMASEALGVTTKFAIAAGSFILLWSFAIAGSSLAARANWAAIALCAAAWCWVAFTVDDPVMIEALTRLGLGVPASLCAAIGLSLDPRLRPPVHWSRNPATLAAVGCFLFAFFQLWSRPGDFFPATVLNTATFESLFGMSCSIARAGSALIVAAGVLGLLDHFDGESRREFEQAAAKAQAELMASQARLAEAQRIGKMGSWEWNIATNDLVWSDEIYRIFDFDRATAPSFPDYLARIHPDDLQRLQREIQAAMFDGVPYDTCHRIVRPDGSVRVLQAQGEVESGPSGQPARMFGICYDITERVALERQSDEQRVMLRNVMDSMFTFVCLLSTEGVLVEANRAALEAFDDANGEGAIGQPIWETYYWSYSRDSQKRVREAFTGAIAGRVVRGDYVVRAGNDRYMTIDAIMGPLRDREGRVVQVIISAVDVTARKQAEEAVKASEARLRTILESEPECVKILDAECRLVDMNAAGLRMIGAIDFQQVAGQSVLDLVDPKYKDAYVANVARVFAGQTTMHQFEIISLDGKRRWMEQHAAPLFDPVEQAKVSGMLAVARDITERVTIEEAAKRSAHRLEQAQRIANIGSWEWDCRTDVLTWSDQVYRILGYEKSEVTPSRATFLARVHPDERSKIEDTARQAMKNRGPFEFDHRIVFPDGEIRMAHELAEISCDAAGRPLTIFGAIQDVTLQYAAREELLEAKLKAESANHAKSRFVASMSHELRTPLNAIIGFSELLMSDTQVSEVKRREYATDIQSSGKHLLSVINDILDISRIEAGKVALEEDVVGVTDLVDACCRMARPRAEEGGVEMHQRIEPGVTHLLADRRLLLQTLLNLVSNAVKFTASGGRVDLNVRKLTDGDVEIAVRDTGIGMSPEDVKRVGEPFLQIDGRHARKFEGTGLGLVIAKRLTELHGGRLMVESTLGVGTTMSLRLPAVRVAEGRETLAAVG